VIAAIDTGKLLELVWVAGLAGIGFCGVFAFAILGITRAGELRRERRAAAASLYLGLAIVALVAFVGAVVWGIVVTVSK
jgi:hypothetical protein